jgi:hypothetical protein
MNITSNCVAFQYVNLCDATNNFHDSHLSLNQGLYAHQCIHAKSHHHHINYLSLDNSIFLT